MDTWLGQFADWFSEENEYEDFIGTLLKKFSNWSDMASPESRKQKTLKVRKILEQVCLKAEEIAEERSREQEYFHFAQILCSKFSNWRTEAEENEEFASVLCQEFSNWVTKKEEKRAYDGLFLKEYFL